MKPGTVPHRFRKWVTSEVLPTIRKTGRYDDKSLDRRNLAFALASEVAQKAARAVFESVMSGDDDWDVDRWLFSFSHDRDGSLIPYASVIERNAHPVSMETLAEMISEPGGMYPKDQELAVLAEACSKRLVERIRYRNEKRKEMID